MATTYGYARVSTLHQDLGIQMTKLREYGIPEENIFCDKKTGKTMDREEFKELLEVVKPGDTIVAVKLDRLGRSVTQVTNLLDELSKKGIYVKILDNNIDTSKETMETKILVTLFSLMADLEREFIQERTTAGMRVAKANGVKFGPKRKTNKDKEYTLAIEKYLAGGVTVNQAIDTFTGLNPATFYRRLKEYKLKHGIE